MLDFYLKRAQRVDFDEQVLDKYPIALSITDESLPWLICIGGLNQRMGMPVHEFVSAAKGAPANKLFVRDMTRQWYQKGLPGLAENFSSAGIMLGVMLDRLNAGKRMAAASSAGGFAALGWAHSMKLDYSVIFSPQSTIRASDKLRHDTRWLKFVWKSWLLKNPTLDVSLEEFYSKEREIRVVYPSGLSADRYQARRLEGLPGVNLDERNSSDHSIVRNLRDSGELSVLLTEGLEKLSRPNPSRKNTENSSK